MASIPGIGLVVPAMGYSQRQVEELAATINAAGGEVVVASTPIGLGGCSASAVRSAAMSCASWAARPVATTR
jgi:predicted GTPase